MRQSNRRDFLGDLVKYAVGSAALGLSTRRAGAQSPRAPSNVQVGAFVPPTPGVPSITGVSGTLTNGGTITIAGASFGTKATAAPTIWSTPTFEAASVGAYAGALGYDYDSGGWHPRITNSVIRSCRTKSMHCQFLAPEYGSSWGHVNATRVMSFYVDYWMYLVDGPPSSRNVKLWWFLEWPSTDYGIVWCGPHPNQLVFSPGHRPWYDYPSATEQVGQWYHFQAWCVEGDPDTANGTFVAYYNGRPVIENDSYTGYRAVPLHRHNIVTCSTSHSNRRAMMFGNYYATDVPVTNGHTYWSDVYYDIGTCARVELGNNAAYESCTHREIQIPQTWASNGTRITATLNTGSFAAGSSLYLFVVDSAHTFSAGFPVRVS